MTKIMHSGKKQNNRQKNSVLEENLAGLALLKLSGTVAAPPGALPSLPPIYRAGHRTDDSHHLPSPAVPWTQRLQCQTVPRAPSVLSDRGSRARSPRDRLAQAAAAHSAGKEKCQSKQRNRGGVQEKKR